MGGAGGKEGGSMKGKEGKERGEPPHWCKPGL